MHDPLAGAEALRCDPPARRVLTDGRDEVRSFEDAFALHAQDVDNVGAGDLVDLVRPRSQSFRDQRRRADEHHRRAHQPQGLDEGACDARVENVTHDRDVESLEPPEGLAHRVEVEQRLRRMLVLAVARVHDVRIGVRGDELCGADLGMAKNDHVRVVGRERQGRVFQRFALVDR